MDTVCDFRHGLDHLIVAHHGIHRVDRVGRTRGRGERYAVCAFVAVNSAAPAYTVVSVLIAIVSEIQTSPRGF